ncbi:hypothetical protein Tcan_16412 [Toxocara canis]|uniref:Uncharacterized protein n=1 Tax=Toxocara canis TaxID=6265 RepID=A0A0B2UYA4_TOXCA|nr:hypothetical protein Tcan_16412 [Toxocara canis]
MRIRMGNVLFILLIIRILVCQCIPFQCCFYSYLHMFIHHSRCLKEKKFLFNFFLMLPISVLPLCLFRKQGYVLVKDANIPQSQDLPQKTTPKPPEGWGDKNDDTLRNVKTLTRSESMKPSDQQAQPHSSDDPLRHKLANDGERKDENRRHEKENEDEKRAEPTY